MTTAPTSTSPFLRVQHLCWRIGDQQILNDVGFSLAEGSFTGILGPNGAGKSSLLRCLYRYIEPDLGTVTFNDRDIWQYSAQTYAKLTAVVLQETPSQFNLSVFDVVMLGLVPHKALLSRTKTQDRDTVFEALVQVGLAEKVKQPFSSLSGGEKQRCLIARAIVQKPSLLIMDEPTSHLDVKYQIQIMELAKSLGITVIASFHDLNLASAICDNLLVLKRGKLVAQGTPQQVINEQMLSDVFDVCASVKPHPQQHVPQVTYFYGYLAQQRGEHDLD